MQNYRMRDRLSGILDMSAQTLPGIPVVELLGTERTLIENHNGVIEYTDRLIRIKVKYGAVTVEGSCLRICLMSKYQVVIAGKIDSIRLERL